MAQRKWWMAVLAATWLLAGCSLFIDGLEEGRPCKDGRCPHTMFCVDGICTTNPPPVTVDPCSDDGECACDHGTGMCDVDGVCRCLILDGRFDGAGSSETSGRFDLMGASLTPVQCVDGEDAFALCGGFSQ